MARTLIEIGWPGKGVIEGTSFERQPSQSMRYAKNVRAHDPRTGQFRGSQRSGLDSYVSLSGSPIQEAFTVVAGGPGVSGSSLATRTVYPLIVKGGTVRVLNGSSFAGAVMSSTPAVLFGVPFFGNAYFVDGTGRFSANVPGAMLADWSTQNIDPSYPDQNAPPAGMRLIQAHRSRIFVAGKQSEPENWYCCAVGEPYDWRTAPRPTRVTQAMAGNLSDTCRVGDVINTMIPWTNDTLVFGGDQTLSIMSGDPAAGGRVYQVNNALGMLFGRPWAFDDSGVLYFVGSQGGFYRWVHGGLPENLSTGRVDRWITNLDLSQQIVRLAWNHVEQGVHVWTTDLAAGGNPKEHLFWSRREDAFYIDEYADSGFDPICPMVLDGSAPGDRKLLVGTKNGGLWYFNADSFADASGSFGVVAWLGPFSLGPGRAAILDELQVTLGKNSADDLLVEVFDGNSVEDAFSAATARSSFVAEPGRNNSHKRLGRGAAFFLKLSRTSTNGSEASVSFEAIRMWLTPVGRAGQREH